MELPQQHTNTGDQPVKDRDSSFVQAVLDLRATNKGLAARLRRADNPGTEYQCWDFLVRFGCNLEQDRDRAPLALIAAAICKSDQAGNGNAGLGTALLSCYDNEPEGAGKARLMRLLSCDSLTEVCRILRPVLALIASKGTSRLDYATLLRQLRWFDADRQRIQARWAQEYYRTVPSEAAI
ncbi:type I-E CRISPR-associated protein Cse2/CasB [Insolitispirillum peregrinum]|uniref:type I-E CRISPR-associated protein Cse2/CasB n=1 Tax=Insolitispirillum peregrinum TaxID=80876 RepID=UPI0036213EBC